MSKTIGFDDVLAAESPKIRAAIKRRGAELVEEITLRRLREAAGLSQTELAKKVGTTQNRLSRIERGEDVRLSTLDKAIRGLGGSLELIARLPGRDVPFSVSSGGQIKQARAKPAAAVRAPARKAAKARAGTKSSSAG
ncbi:MAG: helix-turn-helix transcriptional regulator [Devosia sp.]